MSPGSYRSHASRGGGLFLRPNLDLPQAPVAPSAPPSLTLTEEDAAAFVVHTSQPFDVDIGRNGGPRGNQFVVGRHGTQDECVARYREALHADPAKMAKAKLELRGKILGCPGKTCPRPGPCHGTVLAQVANSGEDLTCSPWPDASPPAAPNGRRRRQRLDRHKAGAQGPPK